MGPVLADGSLVKGKLGKDGYSTQEGKDAAGWVGRTIISSFVAEFGSLKRFKRVVKLLAMVNCTQDFEDHITGGVCPRC
jgi:hypothetical protein